MKLFLNARFYIDCSFNNSIQAILVDRGKIVSLLDKYCLDGIVKTTVYIESGIQE